VPTFLEAPPETEPRPRAVIGRAKRPSSVDREWCDCKIRAAGVCVLNGHDYTRDRRSAVLSQRPVFPCNRTFDGPR